MALHTCRLGVYSAPAPSVSLDFEASTVQRLSLASGSFSYDTAMFAISIWIKRESTGAMVIYDKSSGSSNAASEFRLSFSGSNQLGFRGFKASAVEGDLITTATYTSTDWMHILVWWDSANATAGDRMRMWVDGTEVTSFSTDINPTAAVVSKSVDANVGANGSAGQPFDGLMYQVAFFSGALPAIGDVYDAGSPKEVIGLTGLYSLLEGAANSPVVDSKLSATWTNNGGVTLSSVVP